MCATLNSKTPAKPTVLCILPTKLHPSALRGGVPLSDWQVLERLRPAPKDLPNLNPEWYERWLWYWCTGTHFKVTSNFSTQVFAYRSYTVVYIDKHGFLKTGWFNTTNHHQHMDNVVAVVVTIVLEYYNTVPEVRVWLCGRDPSTCISTKHNNLSAINPTNRLLWSSSTCAQFPSLMSVPPSFQRTSLEVGHWCMLCFSIEYWTSPGGTTFHCTELFVFHLSDTPNRTSPSYQHTHNACLKLPSRPTIHGT